MLFRSVTTWFWKIAGAEPASYQFVRIPVVSSGLLIAAYSGVSQTGSPFDATLAMPNSITSTPMAPSVTTGRAGLLLVVNALCPDSFAQGWATPSGFVARQTTFMLSADAPQKGQGDTGAVVLPTDANSCRFTTFVTPIKPD